MNPFTSTILGTDELKISAYLAHFSSIVLEVGLRANPATKANYLKATGNDKEIYNATEWVVLLVSMKRTHYSMAVYRRRFKMPLKGIKMLSKTFLGILKNACYKLDLKSLLRHFFKTPSNINI
jgi:hypothetical protein